MDAESAIEAPPDTTELVERYGKLVTSICRSFFHDEEKAREAAQEAWVEILEGMGGFRGESRFATWLYKVVHRRLVRMKVDDRLYGLRTLRAHYHGDEFPDPGLSRPDLDLWAMETCRECMKGVLFCLDADSRLVFIFRFVVGLPYAEIARIMDKTEESLRQAASRARRLVGSFIEGDCGLSRKGAKCLCRNDRWIKATELQARFARLGRAVQIAVLYRNAGLVFPARNYWAELLEAGRGSTRAV